MRPSTHAPSPLQHWQSLVNHLRTRQLSAAKQSEFQRAGTLCSPLLPRISNDVLMCVNQTCAALGGAGHRTLADWREAEEQLKGKIQHEKRNAY